MNIQNDDIRPPQLQDQQTVNAKPQDVSPLSKMKTLPLVAENFESFKLETQRRNELKSTPRQEEQNEGIQPTIRVFAAPPESESSQKSSTTGQPLTISSTSPNIQETSTELTTKPRPLVISSFIEQDFDCVLNERKERQTV